MKTADRLNRLRIASPCPVRWEQMSGADRVRLCHQCNLHIYNIAEMTRREAESLIANTEGRICARIYRRDDGTITTKDCPVGLRAIRRRVSKTAGAVFATAVSVFGTTFGRGRDNFVKLYSAPNVADRTLTAEPTWAMVGGTVTDPNGDPIKDAVVTLINLQTNQKQVIRTNRKGQYHFQVSEFGSYKITVKAHAFSTFEEDFAVHLSDELQLDVSMMIGGAMVGVIVIEEPKRKGFDLDGVHIRINEK